MRAIVARDLVRKILIITLLHPAVGQVIMEMLSFIGNEMYMTVIPHRLVGKTFGEATAALAAAVPLGVLPVEAKPWDEPIVNPPDDFVLSEGDQLVTLARDAKSAISVDEEMLTSFSPLKTLVGLQRITRDAREAVTGNALHLMGLGGGGDRRYKLDPSLKAPPPGLFFIKVLIAEKEDITVLST